MMIPLPCSAELAPVVCERLESWYKKTYGVNISYSTCCQDCAMGYPCFKKIVAVTKQFVREEQDSARRNEAMPYEIKKSGKGYKVAKKSGGKTFSKKPLTKGRARSQLRAIYANENK